MLMCMRGAGMSKLHGVTVIKSNLVEKEECVMENKDYEMLIDFVRRCCVYHPDETPEWFYEEEGVSRVNADAFDMFRLRYGAVADCDVVRNVCEEARKIMEHLEVR